MTQLEKRNGFGHAGRVLQEKTNEAVHQNVPEWVRTGVMKKGCQLATTEEKAFTHSLGRVPTGFLVMNIRSDSTGVNDLVATEVSKNAIRLVHVGAGTLRFDLWIY